MNAPSVTHPDPRLDLVFERITDVPRALIWRAWTVPDLLMQWFTPAPWTTVGCEIDLHPGGLFSTVMQSPEGQKTPNVGCYLEVVENERLVWTNALSPGWRPAASPGPAPCETFYFTAAIELLPAPGGTRYTATVMHANEEARAKHDAMGFQEGWGAAFDQLVALVRAL